MTTYKAVFPDGTSETYDSAEPIQYAAYIRDPQGKWTAIAWRESYTDARQIVEGFARPYRDHPEARLKVGVLHVEEVAV